MQVFMSMLSFDYLKASMNVYVYCTYVYDYFDHISNQLIRSVQPFERAHNMCKLDPKCYGSTSILPQSGRLRPHRKKEIVGVKASRS